MNEWDAFDRALSDSMEALPPPEEEVKQITPWRKALDEILIGLVLTTVRLNLLYLQYILPAVGAAHLYLGFRTLRRDNKWFRLCWLLAMGKAVFQYAGTLLIATPLANWAPLNTAFSYGSAAVTFALYFFFRLALRTAFRKVGQTPSSDPLLGVLVVYGVITALGIWMPNIGLWGGIAVLAAFGVIVKLVSIVGDELDQWGYTVAAAPVRVSDDTCRHWYYRSLLVLVVALALFSNHTVPAERALQAEGTTAIRTELAARGFPEGLLSRLEDGEVETLAGATACHAVTGDNEHGGDPELTKLRMDTVFVRLSPTACRVYEFFTLEEATLRSNWQNILRCYPEPDPQSVTSDVAARLTWSDRRGRMQTADITLETGTERAMFGSYAYYMGHFSYPFFSQSRGGYLRYTLTVPAEDYSFVTGITVYLPLYTRLYPYQTAPASSFSSDWYGRSHVWFWPVEIEGWLS